jgi:hypothetical protein
MLYGGGISKNDWPILCPLFPPKSDWVSVFLIGSQHVQGAHAVDGSRQFNAPEGGDVAGQVRGQAFQAIGGHIPQYTIDHPLRCADHPYTAWRDALRGLGRAFGRWLRSVPGRQIYGGAAEQNLKAPGGDDFNALTAAIGIEARFQRNAVAYAAETPPPFRLLSWLSIEAIACALRVTSCGR